MTKWIEFGDNMNRAFINVEFIQSMERSSCRHKGNPNHWNQKEDGDEHEWHHLIIRLESNCYNQWFEYKEERDDKLMEIMYGQKALKLKEIVK